MGELLRSSGYRLQANAKTKEGLSNHPDRDAQFEHINALAQDFISRGLPVISVDAKKKEAVGEHANPGRECLTNSRQHRHSSPQSIACCRMSIIGPSIQKQVG